MSKFSNFMSTIASKIQSTFVKIKPYKKILFKPEEHVIHLISLRNGQIIAFLRKGYEPGYKYFNVYLYDSKDNYSSPQNIEFEDLDKNDFINNNCGFNSFEFENEDIVLSYDCKIEIRKKENNKCSLIKKIFYSGRVSDFKIKKLENNRFLVARVFELFVRVWGQNKINKKYECIFEKTVKYDFYFSLFINNNSFLILQDKTVLFYKHNFNNGNINKLLNQYKSNEVHNMILETKKYEDETILKYDFKCEIVCKLTNNDIGVPKCIYKNNIYFFKKNELCSINYNNFKVKKYYIDLDYDPYRDYSLCFISNDKLLVLFTKKIIVYKLNENGRFLKNKKCSENFEYVCSLTKRKNGDIIIYADKILFFNRNELLKD